VLQLKSAYQDGTIHIVMAPLEFMQRLAALVPRPRLHLIRLHGVLAPNAKLRGKIIPSPAERATEASTDDAHAQVVLIELLKRVSFGSKSLERYVPGTLLLH
jgi:Putative transposase